MISLLIILTLVALFIPIYVYIGYPFLLIVLNKLVKGKALDKSDITPMLSMIVSCYNEVDIIEQKIKNCLSLDYPSQQLEVVFVSDGSDDGTDEVIRQCCSERIKLIRQEGRLGKTMGLNLALAEATGEIVVFSDANAMYKEDALKMLVRNFHDSSVGYVVGAAIYKDEKKSSAGSSENAYWQYEIFIKKIESKLHSVVGGDGAIYAIRKSLYLPLDKEDINDFVNPLQIIAQGYRGIFDAEAICYEQTAGDFDKEGKRKQRIVNRSFTGLMKNKIVLNPFKFGFYALELLSHKLLRWLVPFFIIISGVGIVILAQMQQPFFQWLLALGIVFSWSIVLGKMLQKLATCPSVFLVPYYFYLVNYNSMKGVLQSLRGKVQVTWSTPRDQQIAESTASIKTVLTYVGFILASLWLFQSTVQSIL